MRRIAEFGIGACRACSALGKTRGIGIAPCRAQTAADLSRSSLCRARRTRDAGQLILIGLIRAGRTGGQRVGAIRRNVVTGQRGRANAGTLRGRIAARRALLAGGLPRCALEATNAAQLALRLAFHCRESTRPTVSALHGTDRVSHKRRSNSFALRTQSASPRTGIANTHTSNNKQAHESGR